MSQRRRTEALRGQSNDDDGGIWVDEALRGGRTEVLLIDPKILLEFSVVEIHFEAGCAARGTIIKRWHWAYQWRRGGTVSSGWRAVSACAARAGTAGQGKLLPTVLTWVEIELHAERAACYRCAPAGSTPQDPPMRLARRWRHRLHWLRKRTRSAAAAGAPARLPPRLQAFRARAVVRSAERRRSHGQLRLEPGRAQGYA